MTASVRIALEDADLRDRVSTREGQRNRARIISRGVCVAVLVMALCCAGVPLHAQNPTEPQLSDDEAAIYTALFQEIYQAAKGRPIVLSDQTALGVPPGMIANIPVEGPQTKRFLDQIAAETRQDYEDRNHQSARLPSPCRLAPECVTANIADLAPEVKNDKAWRGFFKKYINSPGIVVVSRIGFNRGHTEAIVYTGCSCGTLCGQGDFAWMVKHGAEWVVQDRAVVWISQK